MALVLPSAIIPSLAALRLVESADIRAPTRRASGPSHFGLSSDSSEPVWLVAVSRIAKTRDEAILNVAAASPMGTALLDALRPVVQRVAGTVAGSALTLAQMITLFNLSASHVASRRLYDSGLTLPSKLPWPQAKELLAAFLAALTTAVVSESGTRVAARLLQVPQQPVDGDAAMQVDLAAVAAAVCSVVHATWRCTADPCAATSVGR